MFCWCIAGILSLYLVLRYLLELITVKDLKRKAIFITGCDSGFGREFAIYCAKNGLHVFAGCLTLQGRETLKEETAGYSGVVEALLLDVTKDESVNRVKEFITKRLHSDLCLWAVVNNAGILPVYGPSDWSTVDDFKTVLDVNTFGVIRVTLAFLPLLKQSKGRLVTTTSVLSRMTLPGIAPYQCSKYGTAGFMDTIRQELRPFGIKCCIIEPEIMDTPLIAIAPIQKMLEFSWNRLSQEKREEYGEDFKNYWSTFFVNIIHKYKSIRTDMVVQDYYHAATAMFPRTRYYSGWKAIFFYVPVSLMPTEIHDLINRAILNQKKFPASTYVNKHQ